MADLRTKLINMDLKSPFVMGSGPCGWDAEALAACSKAGCGAVVTKSITIPGVTNTTRHMALSGSMGLLNNEGGSDMPMTWWRDEQIKKAKDLGVECLIASVYGYAGIEKSLEVCQVAEEAGADMIEFVNGYTEAADLVSQLKALKENIRIPIIAKVNGNWKDTEEVARACDEAGADAITAIDSIGPTYRVDIKTGRSVLGGDGYGYMTGEAILPIALRFVHDIAKSTDKQIIGLGGVTNAQAALEMLMAGASFAGVCTAAVIKGPDIFKTLTEGLNKLMDKYGYPDIASVSGLTLRTGNLPEVTPDNFVYEADKCVRCNRCVKACAYRARYFDGNGDMRVDKDACRVCGLCFGTCNPGAIYIKE